MEKNGNSSSSKRTKHIKTRYLFVTYRIEKQYMSVEWFPTGGMNWYFLNKPNQIYIFNRFRHLIMGVMPETDPSTRKQGTERKIKLGKVSKSKI